MTLIVDLRVTLLITVVAAVRSSERLSSKERVIKAIETDLDDQQFSRAAGLANCSIFVSFRRLRLENARKIFLFIAFPQFPVLRETVASSAPSATLASS